MKRNIFFLAGMICLLNIALYAEERTRTITDLAGRKVQIPYDIKKVACLVGPSYEKVFMLGEKDKIKLKMPMNLPWAVKLNPYIKKISPIGNAKDPNVEEILSKGIDVVFFWNYPKPLEKMISTGINVVVMNKNDNNPQSIDQFVDYIKEEVMIYGEVLGGKSKEEAREWCKYFDEKVKYILSKTSKIPQNKKEKVYYIRGPEILTSHGRYTNTRWYVEIAGGNFVTKNVNAEKNIISVNIEQISAWNPDVIFMGRLNSTDPILKNPAWAAINAVKNKKVYLNPNGVMYWDYSSEGMLLMEFIAKKLYPELFKDLDLAKEVREYYKKFYGVNLTKEDSKRIIGGMNP